MGFFGNMFDLNNDGKLGDVEKAIEFSFLMDMFESGSDKDKDDFKDDFEDDFEDGEDEDDD